MRILVSLNKLHYFMKIVSSNPFLLQLNCFVMFDRFGQFVEMLSEFSEHKS